MHFSFELKKEYCGFASMGPKKEKEEDEVQLVCILVDVKGLRSIN